MKAVEYYDKYAEDLCAPEVETGTLAIKLLLKDLQDEMLAKKEERHIASDRAIVSLIREMNTKWNAIVNLLIKRKGRSPIKRDGFWIFMESVIPELKSIGIRG